MVIQYNKCRWVVLITVLRTYLHFLHTVVNLLRNNLHIQSYALYIVVCIALLVQCQYYISYFVCMGRTVVNSHSIILGMDETKSNKA